MFSARACATANHKTPSKAPIIATIPAGPKTSHAAKSTQNISPAATQCMGDNAPIIFVLLLVKDTPKVKLSLKCERLTNFRQCDGQRIGENPNIRVFSATDADTAILWRDKRHAHKNIT